MSTSLVYIVEMLHVTIVVADSGVVKPIRLPFIKEKKAVSLIRKKTPVGSLQFVKFSG